MAQKLKNKNVSIIANNCTGAEICHNLGLRFNSPLVNLQILPEDYIKFCRNLNYYLAQDIRCCTQFIERQRQMIRNEFGREAEELSFPFGLCGDVLLALQHYDSFDKAKEAWERRRSRVDFSHLGVLMTVDDKYEKEAREFDELNYANKVLLTVNWTIDLPHTRTASLQKPAGIHYFEYETTFKKYYERNFHIAKWVIELADK